jgi:hypothetical protein
VTAVRLAVLVAILLVVQGCGSSDDSSEPAQVSVPSVTAPSIPQPDPQARETNAGVAPKPSDKSAGADNAKSSQKSAGADNPESGTKVASDQDKAKRGGSGETADGKSTAASDAQRAQHPGGSQNGSPSQAEADRQKAGY